MPCNGSDRLTRDCFGRVVTTHRCPECGASFLGPAECRPSPANNFAHPEPVQTLPIYGCDPPPDQTWVVALHVGIKAHSEEQAFEMAQHVIAGQFPARVVERYANRFYPVALNTREEAMRAALPGTEKR